MSRHLLREIADQALFENVFATGNLVSMLLLSMDDMTIA